MDQRQLIQEFIDSKTTLTKLGQKYNIPAKEVVQIFKNSGYIFGRSANKNCVLHLKDAIKDYKTGEYSITTLSKKYKLASSTISHTLKSLGVSVINKQNLLRFDEHIFDNINTEEKAY